MTGLLQVKRAVIGTLASAGIEAVSRFAGGAAKKCLGPRVAVELGEFHGKPIGFCNYLGCAIDNSSGAMREYYGKQLTVSIHLDIYAPDGADSCEATRDAVVETLFSALPSGLRPGELTWEGVHWDAKNELYCCHGTIQCVAYFTAAVDEGALSLLDFKLKGVVLN